MRKRDFSLIRRVTTCFFLFLAVGCTVPFATAKDVLPTVINQVTPSTKHANLDRTIAQLLSHYHYRQVKLDDTLSGQVLDTYLSALDPARSYFLARDIAAFEKYRYTLDDYLRAGNLQPAYDIFNVYQRRLAEQTDRILKQLKQPFNFTIKESLALDRKEAPWATSVAQLNALWRKRLKHEMLNLILAGQDQAAARDTLQQRYEGLERRATQSTSDDVFQLYINALAQSFDPHTAYFSPRATENFNIQMRLSLEGIGSVLRMEDERVTIVELVPGGPADLSKQLRPKDKIVGVAQGNDEPMTDIIGWRLDDVVDLIRGPRGTVVRLQIVPAKAGTDGPSKTVKLVRDTIKLEKQAARSEIKTIPVSGGNVQVGVIVIPTFYSDFAAAQQGEKNYRSTTRDVRQILKEMRNKVDSIVVDLRQNGGGSLQEAVELTGLFIEEGPIVQVRDTGGGVEIEEDPDANLVYEGPLVVLVDHLSASASEIFAGAIQDYGRGIVVGDPTFGKGTVQTLIDLSRFIPNAQGSLGQLKLTIAKFYRISGGSTQHRGVVPDIILPSLFDADEVGESTQDTALPWDEIRPVRYSSDSDLTTLVPELARRHRVRTASDPEYSTLLEDIQAAKEARNKTTVSLLQRDRKIEWEKAQNRLFERENQYRAAQGLSPLSKGEEIPEHEEGTDPDPLLDESTHIAADLAILAQRSARGVALTGR
ncbi:MAG: carboxy terminal-processing peptidase [Candidatus Competibacteraceae bacterium]|nr:carboxy terminal-processing peptidase [Candidatus Competibacteraceae bacterium]